MNKSFTDMQTLESNKKPNLEPQVDENAGNLPDFTTEAYKDAYSRINAIVIEGEQEAYDNYISIASLLPKDSEELTKLAKMELKHKRGFIACGKNLSVEADMVFAKEFFSKLHGNFQAALENENLTTCLLIQAILIEAFAISAYHVYIRVADPFAKKITQGVVNDEYLHLNYGEKWLKENLHTCKNELIAANKANLPLIKKMLDQVADDAAILSMDKEELMEEFMIAYQDALLEMGLDNREIARMAMAAIV